MLICLTLLAAALAGPAVPPPHRLVDWSAPLVVDAPGTRLLVLIEATDDQPVRLEALDGGRWRPLETLWHRDVLSVARLDVASTTGLMVRSPDRDRVDHIDWDLFTPGPPEPRHDGTPPPGLGVLPTELIDIGVVSRDDWGAQATTCSSVEDEWYRMAIHHTAGSQTSGGTVHGAVQSLQAYALGTGVYCDIPYQFLVGYDGSLWEGRPYGYYSGATGGGNNDGNSAVCFLGCYHPDGCSTSHDATDDMMDGGQLMVQTFTALHGIESTSEYVRGHQDWPDNATACPGDYILERFDELLAPLVPDYAGELVALSCDSRSVEEGQPLDCQLEIDNIGGQTWTPGNTNLAPLPRDESSPFAAEDWLSEGRVTGVDAETGPGETATFSFSVGTEAIGDHALSLALVEEWVTWFPDDGGPAEGDLVLTFTVTEETDDSSAATGATADTAGPAVQTADEHAGLVLPGPERIGTCGCGAGPAGGSLSALWSAVLGMAVLGMVRRRGD